jgi:hypothetical protein
LIRLDFDEITCVDSRDFAAHGAFPAIVKDVLGTACGAHGVPFFTSTEEKMLICLFV